MIDKNTEEEILKEIRKVSFGEITIKINRKKSYVDIKTEKNKRIITERPFIKFEHDKLNINHEG